MSRLGFIAYGAGLATVTIVFGSETIAPAGFLFERTPEYMRALAGIYWILSTFGPVTMSAFVWLLARRIKAQWLLHLLFFPLAIVTFRGGELLFFHAVRTWGDSMMDFFAMFLAIGYLLLTILIHTVALAVIGVAGIRRLAMAENSRRSPSDT